jgi:hypothetical protein
VTGATPSTPAFMPEPAERLRLDYAQTTDLIRTLTDVRFKLLALVPTVSGAAVALLGHPQAPVQLLALGVLGLAATLGILLYDLRNGQIYAYALRRSQQLEDRLGLMSFDNAGGPGGPFSERPPTSLRLLRIMTVNRDSGLALVYNAALAGWSYLVAWGALRASHVADARVIGAILGAAVGVGLAFELTRVQQGHQVSAELPAAAVSSP